MITIEEIIEKSGLHSSRLINVYVFGSHIYGTASEKSDYDILIIGKSPNEETEIVNENFNIHVLSMNRFLEGLRQFNMRNIECLLSPYVLKQSIEIPLDIKIPGLRHMTSHICSNSWVKAKKKIQQGDYYIGIKSLFHSMRIAMFGIQLVEYGTIIDWGCANYIWDNICSKTWTWEELDSFYRSERNSIMTEFRKITEK